MKATTADWWNDNTFRLSASLAFCAVFSLAPILVIAIWIIGLYLGQAAVSSSYGAAGSFAVLLIWVYYSALICFYGAEFTRVYARRYGSQIRPESYAERTGHKPDDEHSSPKPGSH